MASATTGSQPATRVTGLILVKETRAPVANVVVELFDLEGWKDPEQSDATGREGEPRSARIDPRRALGEDLAGLEQAKRLGSCLSDGSGRFLIQPQASDLALGKRSESRPDLLMLILAPDEPGLGLAKRVLHLSLDVRFNAASAEAQLVLLPSALLQEHGIPFGDAAPPDKSAARARVDAHVRELEHREAFDAGVAAYHGKAVERDRTARAAYRGTVKRKLVPELPHIPTRGQFVSDGSDLPDRHAEAVSAGVTALNKALQPASSQGIAVNLYLTDDELHTLVGNSASAIVEVPGDKVDPFLFRSETGAGLINGNPIAAYCGAESGDEACARDHLNLGHPHASRPAAPKPDPDTGAIDEADVLAYLDRLVRDIPSPDAVLRPELGKSRDGAAVAESVSTFSLQKGPAEVPAFHDFHVVQLAFPHVWQQLFDESIPDLAYTANTLGETRFGVSGLFDRGLVPGGLAGILSQWITPVEVPVIVSRFFDITKEEYNDLSNSARSELVEIAKNIEQCIGAQPIFFPNYTFRHEGSKITDQRIIQSLTEQGERLIDAVRHDDYHTMHRTLRDLQERLTGKYEFTVFAASKDYHSVNFGLINTYRQLWEPVEYQAGTLLKTIPLAPKEERKYSVKITRHEKRAAREARKNNTSSTTEQTSTSKVESEIMAKAQSKTNLGVTSEGDADFGFYSGKTTTTFGVEAAGESAQSRKDFREAVLKAVQDYKQETSTEVTTESDWSSETNESGTISNPNDELAVTYLFYELQKRYRVSEQLHRVLPVVFVAQEVPSPDQITPAWVLSNDWIINRALLDDSFRPTLRYLATNSVGDDFSLREMRRNLRQQRNLVETLRIEFSSASMQADNRYRALEWAITQRIAAEEAEDTDGWLSDIGDAVFGGGQSPEAAKAREMAAKDAHQYALEKAEKASAALKQEVNTLHQLTEAYNRALQARLDNETQVKRLLVHLRNNILYYMQAIWTMEPPDQRFMRLQDVSVPVLRLASRSYRVTTQQADDIFESFRADGTKRHVAWMHGTLEHPPGGGFDLQPLVQVADLSRVVHCMGNYLAFALKEHNALTEFMAAPYVDAAFGAMDPDDLSNVSLEQYSRYVCCLKHRLTHAQFSDIKPTLVKWLGRLLASPLRNGDEIVVPTGSLFIESLVDPNPVLERFKLQHRELDVYKVQEEVRKAGLENLRLAARLLNGERRDPDIEKVVVIEGGAGPVIDVDNP